MEFITGNLLDANTEALVNTVNTVGVMGKGIALQFKERFRHNFKVYNDAYKKGELTIGKMLVVKEATMHGDQYIINFPTKTEWFKKSQYNYIEEGLQDLVHVIEHYQIKSVALPPLGCGNGGLKWDKVKSLMEQYLGRLQGVRVIAFQPNDAVKEILQKEENKNDVKLTPGRAMLMHALYRYEKLGETASVFAANKLAYFLQQGGENLKLQFVPYTYGPYAQAVEKVLYALNGKYLTGLEQMKARPFEPLKLDWTRFDEVEQFIKTNLSSLQRERLRNLFEVIDGFESTLALEILASIHFLLAKDSNLTENQLLVQIQTWNERKKQLIKLEYIQIALSHLTRYGNSINFA